MRSGRLSAGRVGGLDGASVVKLGSAVNYINCTSYEQRCMVWGKLQPLIIGEYRLTSCSVTGCKVGSSVILITGCSDNFFVCFD